MKTHKKEGGNCAEVQFFCFMLRKVDAFVTIIIVCLALLAMIGEEGKMREIESAQNETLRMLRDLGRSKTRQREGLFLVEGRKMVAEAVTYARPCKVLVMKSRFPDYEEMVVNHFSDNDIILMPDTLFASFCQAKTPQGIACLVPLPEKQNLPEEAPLVFLDGVQDPGNVGTIIRTADAAGFQGVILGSDSADAYAPKTLQSTMGSIFHIPVIRVKDTEEMLRFYLEKGFSVASTELEGNDFYDAVPSGKTMLVIGSEGHGVSRAVRDLSTHHLKLPMWGKAESLNAAVAAGIMMYEIGRRAEGEKNA